MKEVSPLFAAAARDISRIARYVQRTRGIDTAVKCLKASHAGIDCVDLYPGTGRDGRLAQIRGHPVPGYPHILIHEVTPDFLRVLRVI